MHAKAKSQFRKKDCERLSGIRSMPKSKGYSFKERQIMDEVRVPKA